MYPSASVEVAHPSTLTFQDLRKSLAIFHVTGTPEVFTGMDMVVSKYVGNRKQSTTHHGRGLNQGFLGIWKPEEHLLTGGKKRDFLEEVMPNWVLREQWLRGWDWGGNGRAWSHGGKSPEQHSAAVTEKYGKVCGKDTIEM